MEIVTTVVFRFVYFASLKLTISGFQKLSKLLGSPKSGEGREGCEYVVSISSNVSRWYFPEKARLESINAWRLKLLT